MKRYQVFMFTKYYPKGGIKDLVGTANTYNELVELVKKKYEDEEYDQKDCYINIMDLHTEKSYPEDIEFFDITGEEFGFEESKMKEIYEAIFKKQL